MLLIGIAIGWGLFARARRDLVASLHERAARPEAESRRRAEQAREAERRRSPARCTTSSPTGSPC